MRYRSIRKMDIANAEGIACSLFVQGCSHHCDGCFNPETWDFHSGKKWNANIEDQFIELCKDPHIDHISILGGEPFDQDEELYDLLKRIKEEVGKPIYVWTGYTCGNLPLLGDKCVCDDLIDVLIDGEFIQSERDLNLHLRGSGNQRIIRFHTDNPPIK